MELILTDIWKIPFSDLLQVAVEAPPMALDVSLWHFGSTRLLPVGLLLDKVPTMEVLRFSFPHHFDSFHMKLYRSLPSESDSIPGYQLEEVAVQQSIRWSQEMRDVDVPWLQILDEQRYMKKLHYPLPILGDDRKMIQIMENNADTLTSVTFVGHRERREEQQPLEGFRVIGHPEPWDGGWFSNLHKLQHLQLSTHVRFLSPVNLSSLHHPNLLPESLTSLTFHGCIDTSPNTLGLALCLLVNLKRFTHQARLCPWFRVGEGNTISELQVCHIKEVVVSLPQLREWTLEWCDPQSALVSHFITPASATMGKLVGEWLETLRDAVEVVEGVMERQMNSMKISLLSHARFQRVGGGAGAI